MSKRTCLHDKTTPSVIQESKSPWVASVFIRAEHAWPSHPEATPPNAISMTLGDSVRITWVNFRTHPNQSRFFALVIFTVCGTPCPFAAVCASPCCRQPFSGTPRYILFSKIAHLVQPKVFTCFPAVLYDFDLDLVVCCVISSESECIRVKLACTEFTGEGREAPRFSLMASAFRLVPSYSVPFNRTILFLSFDFDSLQKKKKKADKQT